MLADGQAQLQKLRRQRRPLALLLVDVDHFKKINDRWGHLAGDQVLRHFAATLQHCVQGHEHLLGRYGGEEFVLVLAGGTRGEAMERAAAIRARLQQRPALLTDGPVWVTASVGLAMDAGQGDLSTLLAAADAALYRAKAEGRDRLVCAAGGDRHCPSPRRAARVS